MFGLRKSTGGLRDQVFGLAYELAATWRRYTFIQMTRVNSRNSFLVDDSAINIVPVLLYVTALTNCFCWNSFCGNVDRNSIGK